MWRWASGGVLAVVVMIGVAVTAEAQSESPEGSELCEFAMTAYANADEVVASMLNTLGHAGRWSSAENRALVRDTLMLYMANPESYTRAAAVNLLWNSTLRAAQFEEWPPAHWAENGTHNWMACEARTAGR